MIDRQLADYLDTINIIKDVPVKYGSAFFFFLEDRLYDGSLLRASFRIVRELFSDRMKKIKCRKENTSPLLFFYSNTCRNRSDYKEWYSHVLDQCESYDLLICSSPRFRICNLFFIGIEVKLIKTLNHFYHDLQKSICISSKLFSYIKDFECAKRYVDKYTPPLVVTFCDFHPADSLLTQYCSLKNIETACLQHGSYIGNVDIPSHSFCKHFLCHGITTENYFKKNGRKDLSFEKVGMPQLIYKKIENKLVKKNSKIIGLIFSGAEWEKYDCEMLQIVRDFCKKREKYKIWVKCHPGYGPEYYGEDLRNINVVVNQMTATEFLDKCEFVVVSISTVFIESLLKMIPVFVYDSKNLFYPEAEQLKFKDEFELQELFDKLQNEPEEIEKCMLCIRNMSTETKDVAIKYRSFFNTFLTK